MGISSVSVLPCGSSSHPFHFRTFVVQSLEQQTAALYEALSFSSSFLIGYRVSFFFFFFVYLLMCAVCCDTAHASTLSTAAVTGAAANVQQYSVIYIHLMGRGISFTNSFKDFLFHRHHHAHVITSHSAHTYDTFSESQTTDDALDCFVFIQNS